MSWVIFDIVKRIKVHSQKQELELAGAIATGNLAAAKKLLEQGVNPNVKIVGQAAEPLIFITFEKKWFTLPEKLIGDCPSTLYKITIKEECLLLLLEFGVDPNVRDSLGRTILEMAILWCMPQVVKLLLLNGADPNLKDQAGITPLMKTAILGIQDARPMEDKLQIIEHLIDSGAAIDAQCPRGKTPLMYATGNSRIEVVELLVSRGASLSITDYQGNQARNIIGKGVTEKQRACLQKVLTQPQKNITKYQYKKSIPEGDRLLELILQDPTEGENTLVLAPKDIT